MNADMIADMNAPLTIALMALITLACRAIPMVALSDPERLPTWLRQWLEYMPPAVLAATVAPAVLAPGGEFALRPDLIAFAVCLFVAVRTRQILPPVLAGLAVLIIGQNLGLM